jgi:hypothetical protein
VAKRKAFLIRVSPELLEGLRGLAEQEMRSLNGQIEFMLREGLRTRGRKLRRPADTPRSSADEAEPGNGGAAGGE